MPQLVDILLFTVLDSAASLSAEDTAAFGECETEGLACLHCLK